MATRTKTTSWGFPTRLTDVATATAIASSTRYDTAAKTIYVPEATRTIKRAEIVVAFNTASTTNNHDITKWLLGIKINAVAFDDVTTTSTLVTSGENEQVEVSRDVTSYFVTNDPGTSSFTVQVGIQVEMTLAADNIRNISFELHLTYEYSDAASTHIKTIRVPIQGHASRIGTGYVEIGTDGTAPTSANQLPKLTSSGLLPESSITIRDQYLVVTGNPGSTGSTDLTLTCRLDGATDLTRAVFEQANASCVRFKDIIDGSLMPSTTAAHAVEFKSSAANTFEHLSAVLVVTYEFDPTSSTILNSVMIPLENERSALPGIGGSPAVVDRFCVTLDIQEPTTITMKQSGVVVYSLNAGNAVTRSFNATSQTARPFTWTNSLARDAGNINVMRTDHSSSDWTLARGVNKLRFEVTDSAVDEKLISGYAIINYTSGKASTGCGSHNHTVIWALKQLEGTAILSATTTPTAPSIPESTYRITGVMFELGSRCLISTVGFGISREAGEDAGAGWYWRTYGRSLATSENGLKVEFVPATPFFKDGRPQCGGADVETANRDYLTTVGVAGQTAQFSLRAFVTYHTITFAVAGTITVDGAAYPSADVNVFSARAGEQYGRLIGQTTADGSGNFTVDVSESDGLAWAQFDDDTTNQGKSPILEPGVGDFDITINPGLKANHLRTRQLYIG